MQQTKLSAFDTWLKSGCGEWRYLVQTMAYELWERQGKEGAELERVINRVHAFDLDLATRVQTTVDDWAGERFDSGVTFGYALALTWPRGAHEFDAWIDRALALLEDSQS